MGYRRDRLSNLPLSIIHEVLARVPIRDAIRTGVLSKEWRYTWTTLPRLVFFSADDADVDLENIAVDELSKKWITENFISNVLLHYKGPIHRFVLDTEMVNNNVNIDSIEKWMLCLSRKDIRDLSMSVGLNEFGGDYVMKNLKSSIYSCVKLTKLFLGCCTFDPPPSSFKGFLALTTLQLYNVELSTNEVESLVACCPLLETLDIICCSCPEYRIRSPNLKNLFLDCHQGKLCLYAPLLAKIDVDCPLSTDSETETIVCNYTNLFGSFTNLVELCGHCNFVQDLSVGIESCHHTLVLHHLMVIELTQVNLADTKQQSVVARLIVGAPKLHKLKIEALEIEYGSDAPYVSFEDFGCEPNFTLEKLREVNLWSVCGYHFGMRLIKLLLESSPVLETLNLNLIRPKSATEVLGFRRSSPKARILAESIED